MNSTAAMPAHPQPCVIILLVEDAPGDIHLIQKALATCSVPVALTVAEDGEKYRIGTTSSTVLRSDIARRGSNPPVEIEGCLEHTWICHRCKGDKPVRGVVRLNRDDRRRTRCERSTRNGDVGPAVAEAGVVRHCRTGRDSSGRLEEHLFTLGRTNRNYVKSIRVYPFRAP